MLPKTILVADDEPQILKLMEYSLEEIDCWIETASSGEEAVTKSKKLKIDLLIVDVKLPGIDGIETVREIKAAEGYRDLPVFVVTGHGQSELFSRVGGLGVAAFFTKPFSPKELAAKARKILEM